MQLVGVVVSLNDTIWLNKCAHEAHVNSIIGGLDSAKTATASLDSVKGLTDCPCVHHDLIHFNYQIEKATLDEKMSVW